MPYALKISPLAIYPKSLKSESQGNNRIFIAALFTLDKMQKQSKCPSLG